MLFSKYLQQVSLLYYYLMSFLSEPLSSLWSQQQLSSLLPAVAVVPLTLRAVAVAFVPLPLQAVAVAVVTLPLQAVAGVLAVVRLLFKPVVEVWYAGW
jgi:hypothetical protein